jgi:hypothetical protein
MTQDDLYALLPDGTFYIDNTINKIREYDPYKRFPTAKYHLYEILTPFYELISTGKVSSNGVEASKI